MAELTAPIDRLAAEARERRQRAWSALQAADPDQARWLAEVTAEFGRPDAIRIKVGERVYQRGEFTKAEPRNEPRRQAQRKTPGRFAK